MKTDMFPLNYFRMTFSPVKAFAGRKKLTWFQLILTYLFLISLLMIPITLKMGARMAVDINEYLPNALNLISEETAENFQKLSINEGRLENVNEEILFENETGLVGTAISSERWQQAATVIDFQENNWRIKDVVNGQDYVYTLQYSSFFEPEKIHDQNQLQNLLQEEFIGQNLGALLFTRVIFSAFLIFMMNGILVTGVALILWLTKKSQFSTIASFKEGLTIALSCLGGGTLIASLIGFFQFDIILMTGIQSFSMIVMLFLIYLKTRFNDASIKSRPLSTRA